MNLISQKWLLISSFLFLPLIAAAQKDSTKNKIKDRQWILGAGLGLSTNTRFENSPNGANYYGRTNAAAAIKIGYNIRPKMQVQLNVTATGLSYYEQKNWISQKKQTVVVAWPALGVNVQANYRIELPQSEMQLGAGVGFVHTDAISKTDSKLYAPTVNAAEAGIRIAYTYWINRQVGVGLEGDVWYCSFGKKYENNNVPPAFFYYPLLVNIYYTIK